MIGDTVTVERAGDVIPYITACVPGKERTSPWITDCPACKTALVRRGPELCCPNADCPETLLCNLLSSVRSFGIERLGEPTLRKLMEKFNIRYLHELLTLTSADLLRIEGFQQRSADNLANELARSRSTTEANIIAALNIPNVGMNIAALLLQKYTLAELRTLDTDTLAAIPGIGPERAGAIVSTFTNKYDELEKLLSTVTCQHRQETDTELPTICFTGKMPEKRSFYEKLAMERNLRPVDSVNASLSILVAADITGNSSELAAARKYGIKILSLDDFLRENSAAAPETKEPDLSKAWERGELF